jgi:hypothetical protein
MNCEEFRELVQDLAREEELDIATLENAFTHADSCEACEARLEEAEALTNDLRSMAAHYSSEKAPVDVERALLLAFRQDRTPASSNRSIRWFWLAGVAGVAAVMVFGIVLAGRPKLLVPLQVFRHPAEVKNPAQPNREGAEGTSDPQQTSANSDSDQTMAALNDEQAAGPFMPLSGAFDPASLDNDAVVRVVLSREALESFGVPWGASGNEQVLADLIVANDGTPQAIRVVGW